MVLVWRCMRPDDVCPWTMVEDVVHVRVYIPASKSYDALSETEANIKMVDPVVVIDNADV